VILTGCRRVSYCGKELVIGGGEKNKPTKWTIRRLGFIKGAREGT